MPRIPSEAAFPQTLQQAFAAARTQADADACIVLLHIGAEACGIALGTGAQPGVWKPLPLGAERTAREQFRSTPPSPLDMERAIEVVEEVVMPLHRLIPHGARLFSADALVREIAQHAGLAPGVTQTLSLEAMERTFNRLNAVVQGSPAAHQGLPNDNAFAAALLILRECMHHLRFVQITVLGEP